MGVGKKILVTGGAGYIGSHVVSLLGQTGCEIITIDNFSTGSPQAVLCGRYVEGDIGDQAVLAKLFQEHQFVACFHFAGSIVVPESIQEPIKYYESNVQNSLQLIKLCSQHGVRNFIFSSSAAVYGIPEMGRCGEESLVAPINPYGRSKLVVEWMLEDAAVAYGLNYVALRYFNVAGASLSGRIGQSTPAATHLLKVACEAAVGKREKMSIFGTDYPTPDGTCIRDYIHVDDLAQAHLAAFFYLMDGGESGIFNCGYGRGYSVKEVVAAVKKITGVNFSVVLAGRREGDPPELIAVADKIRSRMDWKPMHDDLELMIKTAYQWEQKLA